MADLFPFGAYISSVYVSTFKFSACMCVCLCVFFGTQVKLE